MRPKLGVLAALLLLCSLPAAADTVSFIFTFNAGAAGLAGQSGEIALWIRGNQNFTATWSSFNAPGSLGALLMQTCTVTGDLTTQLGVTNTDTSLHGPNLPSCLFNPAITTFPSTLSIMVTATFPAGLPIELQFGIGNANDFSVGQGTVYVNTDGNGSVFTGFDFIPGAVNIHTSPNFTVTQVNPVPEPATLALLGTGLAAVIVRRRRKIM